MVAPTLRIEGLPELRARLEGGRDDEHVDSVLREAAQELEARTKRRQNVDTGRMRSATSTFTLGRMKHGVVVAVHYAPFQEFGTGQAGARSAQPDGVPPEYQHGPGPGIPAHPALRPSLIEVRELLRDPRTWSNVI